MCGKLFRFVLISNKTSISLHLISLLLCSTNIMTPNLNSNGRIETKIKLLSHLIKLSTDSKVITKTSSEFNNARVVHNGLCNNIVPDVIVIPTSTNDVSTIVKIVRHFDIPISIRSGGHSYICSNIRQGRLF